MSTRRPKAILFDLDDTLTDRRRSLDRYVRVFARDFAASLVTAAPDALLSIVLHADRGGYNPCRAADLVRDLPWVEAPTPELLAAHWVQQIAACCVPRAGLARTLAALQARGLQLGLITNGSSVAQRGKLDQLDIADSFEAVQISEEAGCKKPDPRIFAAALASLDCTPEDAWFVGDHPTNDVLGARAAGLGAVWLQGMHPWPEHAEQPPARRIATLPELLELL